MTYVPGYKNDIIISYATVDNAPPLGKEYGWVRAFVDHLEKQLKHLRDVELWWDRARLDYNAEYPHEIATNVRQAAVMVVLCSPGYLDSCWCRREREIFYEAVGQQVDAAKRVFLVEIDQVDKASLPAELRRINCQQLWEASPDGPAIRFGFPIPNPDSDSPNHQRFYNAVAVLASQVAKQLKLLRQLQRPPTRDTRPVVFVAEATDDMADIHREVVDYLEQFDLRIVPDSRLPGVAQQARDVIRTYLQGALVFVQLLGKSPGERPDGADETYAALQLRLALELNKPLLQWRAPDCDLEPIRDPRHKALLQGAAVRAEDLEDFKKAILQAIQRRPADRPPDVNMGLLVFINHDPPDEQLAQRVGETLINYGCAYSQPIRPATQEDISKDLKANLQHCDGLIVVYGGTKVTWVRQQVIDALKYLQTQRTQEFRPLWIVDGPAYPKDGDVRMGYRGMKIVDCRNGEVEQALMPLLAELMQGRKTHE